MAGRRKADVFAGGGSLADRLRRRRQMLEGGKPYAASKAGRPKKPKKRL